KSSARTAALVLSAIGLVVMVVCGGFLLSAGAANNPQLAQFQQQGMMTILIVILAGQGVLYIAQIGALLPGSASDYLNQ
ncbi:MAG: hypothetical protein JSS02_22125, partial [Planctomycetes bacterium]|nr:hypothetical protein [Planctomycetota bacterium]